MYSHPSSLTKTEDQRQELKTRVKKLKILIFLRSKTKVEDKDNR